MDGSRESRSPHPDTKNYRQLGMLRRTGEIVLPSEERAHLLAFQYQMVSPENVYTSDIVHIEQSTCALCMYVTYVFFS